MSLPRCEEQASSSDDLHPIEPALDKPRGDARSRVTKFWPFEIVGVHGQQLGQELLDQEDHFLGPGSAQLCFGEEFHTVLWLSSLEKKAKINSFPWQCTPVPGVDLLIFLLPNQMSLLQLLENWKLACPFSTLRCGFSLTS